MKYMTPADFEALYGVEAHTLTTFISKHPEYRYEATGINGEKILLFKYKKWLKDKERIENIINYCHWVYYPVKEIYKTDYKIAKRLALYTDRRADSWNVFISRRLFFLRDDTLSLRLGKMYIEFGFWATRMLIIGRKQLIREGKWEEILERLE